MQSRVENERLPGHHRAPAEDNEGAVENRRRDREILQDEADRIEADSPGRNQEAPEIQPAVLLERHKDDEVELDDIVERKGDEAYDYGESRAALAIGSANATIGHLELCTDGCKNLKQRQGKRRH